jgi:hypothetical protein
MDVFITVLMFFVVLYVVVWVAMHMSASGRRALERGAKIRADARARNMATPMQTKEQLQRKSSSNQQVVDYKSYKAFQEDSAAWLAEGWKIAGMSDSPQRPGMVRMAMLSPIGAYIVRPRSHVWVVYEKAVQLGERSTDSTAARPSSSAGL